MAEIKQENKKRSPSGGYVVPFFVALAVLTVVSFLIPLRPTRSQMEKRDLTQFPEFSLSALVSGSYFDDITLWFSDTFPGRESWLTLASYSESFYGYSEISIQGELPVTETVPLSPKDSTPSTPQAVLRETQPQEQTAPQETSVEETLSEEWGGVDAGDAAEILQSATVIQIGDAVFSALGFSQHISDQYIEVINRFTEEVSEKGVTVVSAPAPTAVGILIEEEYLAKLNCVSQVEILRYLHAGMDDRVVKVDTASALIPHNDEYIYFRTDHHWTALGAYYSYAAVCQALGMEPVDINTLEVWNQGEFVGSLYNKAARPQKLRVDTVDAYIPVGDIVNTVYYTQNSSGKEVPLLSDYSDQEKNTKYLVFGTDNALSHAENRSLPDAPNCLVVKDSFGNCFVPFLTQNFHNVYAVDYRKYRLMPLTKFVEEYDIDYVIFMPYVTATQSMDGPPMLKNLCFR